MTFHVSIYVINTEKNTSKFTERLTGKIIGNSDFLLQTSFAM